jgi:hypothetical protein
LFSITVEHFAGANFKMNIPPTITVGDLKARISQQSGLRVADLWLMIAGRRPSNDTVPVNQMGLAQNGTVTMSHPVPGGNLMEAVI